MRHFIVAVFCLLLASPAIAQPVGPWYVSTTGSDSNVGLPSSPFATIQHAVDVATTVSGDTIYVEAGVYSEHDIVVPHKNLTIIGVPNETTIDAGSLGRVFILTGDDDEATTSDSVVLQTLILTNGTTTEAGGGVNMTDGYSATLIDCTIQNCTANGGGGIAASCSQLNVTDGTISGNTTSGAIANGGGVYLFEPSGSFTGVTVTNNTTTGTGGGIAVCGGVFSFTNCTITGNESDGGGGGILVSVSNSVFSQCTVDSNTANKTTNTYGGGGLYLDQADITFNGTASEHASISNNTTVDGSGGGVYVWASDPTFNDTDIEDNTASVWGGGIYLGDASSNVNLNNCCISGNCPAGVYDDAKAGSNRGQAGGGPTGNTVVLNGCSVCNNEGVQIQANAILINENHISSTCVTVPGDTDGDDDVDATDLANAHALAGICLSDVNHDGTTDMQDLLAMLAGWLEVCP